MDNTLKQLVCDAIDASANMLIGFGDDILRNPELGFREFRTSEKVTHAFDTLGIHNLTHPGRTGVKGWLSEKNGPRIAIIGEMDAVISPQHPYADESTGAAHACGHNAQLVSMLGCALGLQKVISSLNGSVCLMAVPAEEYIEIGWRERLLETGELSYLGGKQQLIAEGAFDDIDIAIMVHSETDAPYPRIVVAGAASGFIGKEICFLGREAHAGGNPWEGINALNAATLAISAIHANRETFPDEDRIRIHPIITKGGDAVNTVPADVRMESYVRAATIPALQKANKKVNRAIKGAAYAVGAKVTIHDMPGYLPMRQNDNLSKLFADNALQICPEVVVKSGFPFCGSTDMGDLSFLLPVIQPTISGFTGTAHGKDFTIADTYKAYILPAKLMAATVIDLLTDGASKAQEIIFDHPRRSKDEYFTLWEEILQEVQSELP